VNEDFGIARAEYERPAQLEGISPQTSLAVTATARARARGAIERMEQIEQARAS
jgi:hypothetical protein